MEEILRINMDDYVLFGEGASGESYNHRSNRSIMLKIAKDNSSLDEMRNEVAAAKKVYDLGIPCPKPGCLVTDGNGRYGIMFERIAGKISFSRAVGDHPDEVEKYARHFARMCKTLHTTEVPDGLFPDIKKQYLKMAEEDLYFSDYEKSKVIAFLNASPDGHTAIHGDLQFSNAVMSPSGDYFIDLGEFAVGSPLFDLGMVCLTCRHGNDDFTREFYHMEPESAAEFWIWFVKEYFGEDADPDEKDALLTPYAGLKTLLIQRNLKRPYPEFKKLLDGVFLG